MNIQSLVDTYGYLALVAGTFLEGETVLILGGFAAHRGYMHLPWVIAAAFAGSLCGDQLFFFLGRWQGERFLKKRPFWTFRVNKAQKLLDRFKTPLILGFRFLYGLRTVAPFVIGMSPVPTARFVALNAVGSFIWAVSVGIGGYFFGEALETFMGNIKQHEIKVFGLIAATGSLIWIIHLLRRRKHQRIPFVSGSGRK